MAGYFAYIDNLVLGPYSQAEMCSLLKSGKCTGETLVQKDTDGQWLPFARFPELVAPSATPEDAHEGIFERKEGNHILFRCPQCNSEYSFEKQNSDAQRITCKKCGCLIDIPAEAPSTAAAPAMDENILPVLLDGNLTCPHCWQHFGPEHLLYISAHPSLMGDPMLGEFVQKRFRPTVFNSLGQALDKMGEASSEMACPHCHLPFPAGMIDSPALYFSIAGATSSGKSYYLTSLTHTLRNTLSRYFGISFLDLDPRLNQTLNNYENLLFQPLDPTKIAVLPSTQISGEGISDKVRMNNAEIELPKPFVFDFQHGHDAASRRNLVFYDNSGELFVPGRDEWVNQATRHLSHSDGITFLFDPANDSVMRTKLCASLDPQISQRPRVVNQLSLLTELISRIRRHANMTAGETCRIPLVVAVCKYDLWKEHFAPELGSPYLSTAEGTSLDLNKILSVSFALRALMLEYAPDIVNTAESFFEHVYFIPVSAFGTLAEMNPANGSIGVVPEKIAPVWVEVPTLTILYENGLIPTRLEKGEGFPELNFKARICDGKIMIQHPETKETMRLPLNYAGTRIEINGKKYDLPGTQSVHTIKADDFSWN